MTSLIKGFALSLLLCFPIACGEGKGVERLPGRQDGSDTTYTDSDFLPNTSSSLTWENYIGHAGFNSSNYAYNWRMIVRQGRFDPTTSEGYQTALKILRGNNLMFGSNSGYPGANDIGKTVGGENALTVFLTKQESTSGQYMKDLATAQAERLLAARTEAGTKFTIFWQLGNEINNKEFSTTYQNWASSTGHPYPHPASPDGDGSGDSGTGVDNIVTSTDTGYLGYMMEYYVGPAIEALNAVNANLPEDEKIKILAGSLANSRNKNNRDWYKLLVRYRFQGTYCPSLAGKYCYQLIDGITHHYLFAEYRISPDNTSGNEGQSRHQVLAGMYRDFCDPSLEGNRIKAVYTTEEIGNKSSKSGRAAYQSVIIGLSYLDFWLENNISPDYGRVMYYGPEAAPDGKEYTSAAFSMNVLAEIAGGRVLTRKNDLLPDDDNSGLEKYMFATDKGEYLLAFTTPSPASVTKPSPVVFNGLTIKGSGYTPVGTAHVFTIDEYLHPTVTLTASGGQTTVSLSWSKNHTNGSLTVSGGKVTKLNGTVILLLKKQ